MKSNIIKKHQFLTHITDFCTSYHIKDIGKDFILFSDRCPKNKQYGNGCELKIVLDLTDEQDRDMKELCQLLIDNSKKKKKCPEVGIQCKLSVLLEEIKK